MTEFRPVMSPIKNPSPNTSHHPVLQKQPVVAKAEGPFEQQRAGGECEESGGKDGCGHGLGEGEWREEELSLVVDRRGGTRTRTATASIVAQPETYSRLYRQKTQTRY